MRVFITVMLALGIVKYIIPFINMDISLYDDFDFDMTIKAFAFLVGIILEVLAIIFVWKI
jgi:hypothetical protein